MRKEGDSGPAQYDLEEKKLGKEEHKSYSVRLASHMERSPFESSKILEKDRDEGCNVLGRVMRIRLRASKWPSIKDAYSKAIRFTYNRTTKISIRIPNTHWLVYKEYVCIGVPGFWVKFGAFVVENSAWSKLHEQPNSRRRARPYWKS